LDTNISDGCTASIFRVEVCGNRKVDIHVSRVRGGVGVRCIKSVSQQRKWEESFLNRTYRRKNAKVD